MKAYQMKITIQDSHPPIWRRFIVPAELSFSQLSIVLNEVMGWCGNHLFSFEFHNIGLCLEEADNEMDGWGMDDFDNEDASEIMLEAYLDEENSFIYVYDFGDDWRHVVVVEKMIEDYEFNYPVVLKFKGETPYEDCGGIHGYYQLLETLKDPSNPEYENMKEWTEEHFTKKYDMEMVNGRLKGLRLGNKKSKPMRQSEIYGEIIQKGQGFKKIQGIKEPIYQDFDGFDDMSEEDEAFFEEILKEFKKNMKNSVNRSLGINIADVTLQDIFRDYTKDVLVDIAKLHQIRGYSKYNKEGLVEFVAKNVLDKDVMGRYFTFLSDEELEIITKFSEPDLNRLPSEEEIGNATELVGGGYCGVLEMSAIVVPKEVVQAYRGICDREWKKNRRMALELCYYLNGAAELYGACSMSLVLEIYNKYTGKHVEELTMFSFCELIPENKRCFIYNGVDVIHSTYDTEKQLEELREKQKDKPFYRPSRKEIELLGMEGYLPFDKYMEDLCTFIYYQLEVDREEAEALCKYIQYIFRSGGAVEDAVELMEKQGFLELPGEIKQIKKHLTVVWRHTRKRDDRGNMPAGISEEAGKGTGNHTLVKQPRENIVKFPVDIKKKIYPNDPCPCGSGKKYKKCCGKNKN